jgi:hypothetical protein
VRSKADVISGEYPPESPLSLGDRILRLMILARLGLYLLPWALMSGGLILVGILALGPRQKDIPELWICLPAGLALLAALLGVPLWLWRRSPPWIQRFEYDGEVLAYTLEAERAIESHPVRDIAAVGDYRCGRGLVGYRITFRDGTSVILGRRVRHADQLRAALKEAVGSAPASRYR